MDEKRLISNPRFPASVLSPLESALLQEYTRLLQNLNKLSKILYTLAHTPMVSILDALSVLERKTGLVFTLFKASVWAILANVEQVETIGTTAEP
ncbi:hypothetical protein PORY_001719 [Pneumocystis oryctolagi]|uniref:Uncharacterized protein n=1 Tax=Pneumocystis oryctolagi TaxID=42067 RepID=A0ACB7CHX2_9ASCO|nr:hypothetical protein PORY_001719 [Pneumocystis oryctolagi]